LYPLADHPLFGSNVVHGDLGVRQCQHGNGEAFLRQQVVRTVAEEASDVQIRMEVTAAEDADALAPNVEVVPHHGSLVGSATQEAIPYIIWIFDFLIVIHYVDHLRHVDVGEVAYNAI